MSDRIDELVAVGTALETMEQEMAACDCALHVDLMTVATGVCTLEAALDAANARADKAEAMCEWMASELYDEDYLGAFTRASRIAENEPYTPLDKVADVAAIIVAAREAVKR